MVFVGQSTRLGEGGAKWPRAQTTLHKGESSQDPITMAYLDPPSHTHVCMVIPTSGTRH